MEILLSALGWVDEFPRGNRLRWSIDFESIEANEFIGLPVQAVVERADVHPDAQVTDSNLINHPFGSIPSTWWEDLPDLITPEALPSRWILPRTAQGLHFSYQGPGGVLRVYGSADGPGQPPPLVMERTLGAVETLDLFDESIREMHFFGGPVQITNARMLDLFDDHDAGLDFQPIAILAPETSTTYDVIQAYQRYPGPPDISPLDWQTFQEDLVGQALVSNPLVGSASLDDPSPWSLVSSVLAVRWEYAMLYGLAFLDGPDAAPGSSDDSINTGGLLDAPTQPAVYRVRCTFANDQVVTSNPVCLLPFITSPLQHPSGVAYRDPLVRLFGESDYELDTTLEIEGFDARAIGADVHEIVGSSPLLDTPVESDQFTFRSWRPTDDHRKMELNRHRRLPFYDTPLRVRARSIDGWDRSSPWTAWTVPVVPLFLHSPTPPPLISAAHIDHEAILIADNQTNSFADWDPDHAARNTPGSTVEVFRRSAAPAYEEHTVGSPGYHLSGAGDLGQFGVGVPVSVIDPERFIGGKLIAGASTTSIVDIDNGRFVLAPVADSTGDTRLFEQGPAALQQSVNHPALFAQIASLPVEDLEDLLKVFDPLPTPFKTTEHEYYAIRVNIPYPPDPASIVGPISNLVSAARHPHPLDPPPPFLVELTGVDFYNRTMVRTQFADHVTEGSYGIYWADGSVVDALEFAEIANRGDHGIQPPLDGLHLFESFSMPLPQSEGRVVTIGVYRENMGGFKSGFTIEQLELPTYTS